MTWTAQASAELVLRYAEAGPNRGTRAEAVQFFADEVERLSGGDITLDIHWGGSLLKWSGVMEGVSAGSADLGSVLSSYEPQELKALGIGDIPLEFSDPWVGMRAMYELMTTEPELRKSLADQSLVYLSNFSTTGVQFECTEGNVIRSVDDIKGKRIRATGTYTSVLSDLGADTVSMTFGEVYQALDTGLVDCLASYFYTMRAYKTYEVVESVTQVDWGQLLGFGIVMNSYIWGDLDDRQKAIFLEAGSNMIDHFAQRTIEDATVVAESLANGAFGKTVPVTRMAPDERSKILAAADKYRDSWIEDVNARGMAGSKIWDRYIELLTQYQTTLDTKGYPWNN
ncbi:ABC transporter substrate-binding protein [Marinobacter salinexigens]|uniref:ABC transporter substrate-binding protein n=2 Tax=Marinobacter salinexigens TaxID=2919747 RepID=A0A5B0VCW6_9GAMM|nr:ABC transporter substrate-binding protein [Marinobacter salinexigens]